MHSVRGSVEGYVKAFDRHFNMLLADVDEEYILNKVQRTHFPYRLTSAYHHSLFFNMSVVAKD